MSPSRVRSGFSLAALRASCSSLPQGLSSLAGDFPSEALSHREKKPCRLIPLQQEFVPRLCLSECFSDHSFLVCPRSPRERVLAVPDNMFCQILKERYKLWERSLGYKSKYKPVVAKGIMLSIRIMLSMTVQVCLCCPPSKSLNSCLPKKPHQTQQFMPSRTPASFCVM